MRSLVLLSLPLGLLLAGTTLAQDCNKNLIFDYLDLREGRSSDCNHNNIPDECDMAPRMAFGPEAIPIDPPDARVLLVDMDRDGDLDLAVSGAESLLLREDLGARRFGPPRQAGGKLHVDLAAAADLDGDGFPELIATLRHTTVVAFANGGDGGYRGPPTVALLDDGLGNWSINGVLAADLDQDGDIDLAAYGGFRMRVAWNAGDGDFAAGEDLLQDQQVMSVTAGEFDGDGRTELAAAAPGGVAILRCAGTTHFDPPRLLTTLYFYNIAAADLDGDGSLDLAGLVDSEITFIRNEGAGGFAVGANLDLSSEEGGYLWGLALADLDGDRLPEVLAAGSRDLLLHNRGGLRFDLPRVLPLEQGDLLSGDVDGDGAIDLAARTSGEVVFLWNPGNGGFRVAPGYPSGDGPVAAAAADLDGDGRAEIAVAATGSDEVVVLRGPGDGSLEAAARIPAGDGPAAIIAADLDGDGRTDLAVADLRSDEITVLRNRGGMVFDPAGFAVGGYEPAGMTAVDLDGDGYLDLAAACRLSGTVSVLNNRGDGSFGVARPIPVGGWPLQIVPADLDGYGREDLAVFDGAPPQAGFSLAFLANRGLEGFAVSRPDPLSAAQSSALVELGGGLRTSVSFWSYLLSSLRRSDLHGGSFLLAPLFADLDGDGTAEVVTADTGTISLLESPVSQGIVVPVDGSPAALAAADLDGDGRPDLVIGDLLGGSVEVLLGRRLEPLSKDADGDGFLDECAAMPRFTRGDANGDGEVDLSDAVFILFYLFGGGPGPDCLAAADTATSGQVDLTSALRILQALYQGTPLPPPFPRCGFDPNWSALPCPTSPPCRR